MKKLLNGILSLPLVILAVDLWINTVDLAIQFSQQNTAQRKALSKNIPLAPDDIQFIQVAGNLLMTALVTLGMISLIWFSTQTSYRRSVKLNGFSLTGLLIVLTYSLPGIWTLFGAITHTIKYQYFPLSIVNPWNAMIALLLPYPLLLLLIRFLQWRKQKKHN